MGFLDNISGKKVEKIVDEYSQVYGEILLGMHKEITEQNEKIEDLLQKIENQEIYDTDEKIIELAIKLSENISKINQETVELLTPQITSLQKELKEINKNKKEILENINKTSEQLTKSNTQISELFNKILKISENNYSIQNDIKITQSNIIKLINIQSTDLQNLEKYIGSFEKKIINNQNYLIRQAKINRIIIIIISFIFAGGILWIIN